MTENENTTATTVGTLVAPTVDDLERAVYDVLRTPADPAFDDLDSDARRALLALGFDLDWDDPIMQSAKSVHYIEL